MNPNRWTKRVLRILAIPVAVYLLLVVGVYIWQRSLLFFPTHNKVYGKLAPWSRGNQTICYCREVSNPGAVWLMLHGNAGQAADRDYVLGCLSEKDSLYVLEYPGYGLRQGSPSLNSINQAASEAYRVLRARYTNTPLCVLGESLGSGPASFLAREKIPPDKIVLVVPFDSLRSVASERFYFLPVGLILRDPWDNVESLAHFKGPIQIFAATDDSIIPIRHAKHLVEKIAHAQLVEIHGGHNDWSDNGVKITH